MMEDTIESGVTPLQAKAMKRRNLMAAAMVIIAIWAATGPLAATNYVNWKGGFWFAVPEGWEKVNYLLVDRLLSTVDSSRDIYKYEAVFAPKSSAVFMEGAYLVVTFDSTGKLSEKATDSILNEIARSYATDVYKAPVVSRMSDLIPGQPSIDRVRKTVSVLTEMAYRPEAKRKLWLHMRLNDAGLISLYFYCPDSTFAANRPLFEGVAQSLSFSDLRTAAGSEQAVFTDVGGDNVEPPKTEYSDSVTAEAGAKKGGNVATTVLYAVIIAAVLVLVWIFVLAPRMKKKSVQ